MGCQHTKDPGADFPGYITPFLARRLRRLSPWCLWERLRNADPKDRPRHAKLVEQYIGLWCVLTCVHVAVLGTTYGHDGWQWIFLALLPGLRIIDIVQANFVRHILMGERDMDGRGEPASVSRIIVLALVNYIELIVAFAVVYASVGRALEQPIVEKASTMRDYLYFSGITQLTIGYGDCLPVGIARLFALVQALVGLALTVFIFARFSSFFKPVDPPDGHGKAGAG